MKRTAEVILHQWKKRREVCLPATTVWNAFHTPFAFNKAIKFLVQQDTQSMKIVL